MSLSCLVLVLLSYALSSLSAPVPSPAPARPYPVPSTRFYLSNITGTARYFSFEKPVHPSVIGAIRPSLRRPQVPPPNQHPRVLVSTDEWNALLERHSDPVHFNKQNTWSKSLIDLTVKHGPNASIVHTLADLERHRQTDVFTGKASVHFSSKHEFERYRSSLKSLADHLKLMTEADSHSLFLCAFWAQVAERIPPHQHFVNATAIDTCIYATVAWAKVLMAHRTYHCNPSCSVTEHDAEKAYLWNYDSIWEVSNDWYTAGATLALAYDVLYQRLSEHQRQVVRSALALLVMKRWTWGVVDQNTAKYPDAETHPHRIVSNWGMYHSHLYITNLAIEGESGFVPYAQHVLTENHSTGFNHKLNRKFEALINAYMTHSVYPDGSSFEDGYTYHTAFREGSLAFLASHRRGHNLLNTARFRNMIHHVAQMFEPWQCAPLVGHSSGGGQGYPAYVGLLRYAYPDGVLPRMVWAQRFGKNFTNGDNCRIWWTQTMTQMVIFGDEHKQDLSMVADAPESLPGSTKKHFPLAYVSTRRGLIIMRSTYSQLSSYMHFDARPDSFYLGHDNADRGIITFSAMKQRWIDDLPWKENVDSRKHSLLHIDGIAQAVKAPSVTILKVEDSPSASIASADLTYTYNIQWAQAWQGPNIGTADVLEYRKDGSSYEKKYRFPDAEVNSPWDLGWPMEDDAADIGFSRNMTMNGNPELAAFGMNEWRRHYRGQSLEHFVRSVIMVRPEDDDVGYGVLVDSVSAGPGKHSFESYLILEDDVHVEISSSRCDRNECKIVLASANSQLLDIHVLALGTNVSFRVEEFDGHRRLIVKSVRNVSEELWIVLCPRTRDPNNFSITRDADSINLSSSGSSNSFRVRETDHVVVPL